MTTFHEPQPQSRRAARQSERGENPEAQPDFARQDGHGAPSQHIVDPSNSRETWDTVARRAAQLPPAGASNEQPATAAEPVGEPLIYTTQARPEIPSYDGRSFRTRVGNPEPVAEQPADVAEGEPEKPAFRVRDFSPEARSAPALSPQWPTPSSAVTPSTDLEYQTQAAPPVVAPVASAAPIAEVPFPVEQTPRPEYTMTRRELRALREQQEQATAPEADVAPEDAIAAPVAAQPVVAVQTPADPFDDFDDLGRKFAEAAAAAQTAVPGETSAAPVEASVAAAPVIEVEQQISALDAAEEALIEETPLGAQAEPPALVEPPRSASSLISPPPLVEPLVARLAASGIPQESVAPAVPAATEPPAYSPPPGHWSLQATIDDETQPYESTINRTIGSTSTTTNALVLPSIPQASDMGPALTSTGEILLTGSIDVLQSITPTGAGPKRFDDPGIDKLFDFSDGEGASTDSAPVRAISAVSTHTSTQAVINTKKPQSNRMLTTLLISASVMAVGVVGLLIASIAFNLF